MKFHSELPQSPQELIEVREYRFKQILGNALSKSPFYSPLLKSAGTSSADKFKLENISDLPFTHKDDLRDLYPDRHFAVPRKAIVRFHSTSGTSGEPVVFGYTREDLRIWAVLTERVLLAAGVTCEDTIQMLFSYGMFTGGLGFHAGAEKLGAAVLPTASGNTERQLKFIKDFSTTVLQGTPSYVLLLAEAAEKLPGCPWKLRLALCGAEAWSEAVRSKIEHSLGVSAFDNYGLTELGGPGVAFECSEKNGLHINEDYFHAEVINPETGKILSEGETGELVFTALWREACPVIRYRTGDLASIISTPCKCGLAFRRITRLNGRCDDMLIVKGVNIFPGSIEKTLAEVSGASVHFRMVLTGDLSHTELEILGELEPDLWNDITKRKSVTEIIEARLKHKLGVKITFTASAPMTLERFEGKAKRVVDNRNKM